MKKADISLKSTEFKKQSVIIKDPEEMKRLSLVAEKQISTFSNAVAGSKIAKLQDTGAFYQHKKEMEMQRAEELAKLIDDKEKLLKQKRDEILKEKKSHDGNDPSILTKKIKNLDVKLDKLRQKHNEALAENENLREMIDALRKENNIFNKIHEKLGKELQEKQKHYLQIKEESDKAKKEINSVKNNLKEAKISAFKEQKNLEKEYQSIFKVLDDENRDDKLRDAKEKKKKDVEFKQSQHSSPKNSSHQNLAFKKETTPANKFYITQYDGVDSPKRGGLKRTRTLNSREPLNLEKLKEDVKLYQEVFNQLKEETQSKDVNKMVETFVNFEDQNYSLFNYLNILSDELESLQRNKKKLMEEIERLENNEEEKKDPKNIKIQETQRKINTTKEQKIFYENKHKDLLKTLNALKIGIPIIFERLGCNNKEYLAEMGELFNVNEINEGNMTQFLSIIERRTNDILQMYNEVFQKNAGEKSSKFNDDSISGSNFFGGSSNISELNTFLDTFTKTKDSSSNVDKDKKFLEERDLRSQADDICKQIKGQIRGSRTPAKLL